MKKEHKILILIFLLSLAFRLYFDFQTPYFSSDEAYFHLKHTTFIGEHFKPIIFDTLSYGGRFITQPYFFHYFLAFFNLFLPVALTLKIIPAILSNLLIIIVYVICSRITKSKSVALLTAFISAFIPIYLTQTINQISIYSLTTVIIFYILFCLLNIKKHLTEFIILSFILPMLDPLSFLLIAALLFYIILLSLDGLEMNKLRKEAIIFLIFLTLLINFLLYKNSFLTFGLKAVWQNTPKELLADYFKNVNVLEAFSNIGIIPLIFGIIGAGFGILREKKQSIYILSGMILADFLLLSLRLINFYIGMMFLGILLTIMSAVAFEKIGAYISMTKFAKYKKALFYIFIILLIPSIMVPSFFAANKVIENSPSSDEINSMLWLKDNTLENSTILAGVSEGNMITAIAERRNVADSNFLLAPDRYSEVIEAFQTQSLVKAVHFLHKYGVNYIYFSDRIKKEYEIKELNYVRDENCFKKVHQTEQTEIYRVLC